MSGAPRIGGSMSLDTHEVEQLTAEVERLQGRIDKLLASPRRCDDCPGGEDYKAEVERLGYSLIASEQDNERLREENLSYKLRLDRATEHEVERLRELVVKMAPVKASRLRIKRCDYEHLENIATLQMEAERLRRIEEAAREALVSYDNYFSETDSTAMDALRAALEEEA